MYDLHLIQLCSRPFEMGYDKNLPGEFDTCV